MVLAGNVLGGAKGGYSEGCRVYKSSIQSIPNVTATAIQLNLERYDTDEIHDNVTNNTRLTCKTAGKYVITAQLRMAANTNGSRTLYINLNGSTIIAMTVELNPTAGDSPMLNITTIYNLAVNDYIEMIVYQNSGGALNTRPSANYSPEFMIQRIG